jgi:adenosylcobinamide-GDP ribazoletransferase
MTSGEFAIAAMTALLPAPSDARSCWIAPGALLAALLAAVLAAVWLAKLFARLGGYTGDCLGAVQQVAEASSTWRAGDARPGAWS